MSTLTSVLGFGPRCVTMKIYVKTLAIMLLSVLACSARASESIDFNRDVRPILADNCFQCHGPDETHREADLRLDQEAGLLQDDNPIVVVERPDESELIARIETDDPDLIMPPADSGKSLDEAQIQLIRQWIAEGAKWKQHWSFVSPRRPELPKLTQSDWVRNEVDQFVLTRLESEQLTPSPEAEPHTLVRRLYFDLTGLPPTIRQVDQFLNDSDAHAYERLVDRILESPHFGERMAVAWLDQARYADTNGYSIDGGRQMWLWRDWVIDAYNRNLPFDQFVINQLAGDLLPDATVEQRVATGFNRNHMITHEGGTIPEENLVNYVSDRVKTTAEVFLGLTMGCAQCHDHKYDPLTQYDYYRFFAYFNTLSDRGLDGNAGRNAVPKLMARSVFADNIDEIDRSRQQLESLERRMEQTLPSQARWEKAARVELATLGQDLKLRPVEVVKVTSPNRAAEYMVQSDGSVFVPNAAGRSPSISARIDVDGVTALRLVFYPDEKFPEKGIGHGKGELNGSLLLTSFTASATTIPSDQVDLYSLLRFPRVTASNSHADYPPESAVDERDQNGWSPHPHNQTPQHITFQLDEPLDASATPYVTVMLVWGGGSGLVGGKYRLFAVTGNDDGSMIPNDVQQLLRIPAEQRTADQAERVRAFYAKIAPELRTTRHRIENLRHRLDYLTGEFEVMVMDIADQPRDTFILNRGQYDQPLDKVAAGTPVSLPAATDLPANRLGLARWLTQPSHPLTARVAVNRLWQNLFGSGIVASSADFGAQGELPSHPELLDWLAVEFVESGWDVKSIIKRIVMSATYRQSSHATDDLLKRDPLNRLLARGPRLRLQAEFVRDNALAVSGLLVKDVGGPSVKPYQPPSLWKEISHYGSTPATAQVYVQDHGYDLFRRSMYTYWKRTVPPPSMISFDAPNREVCTVRRSVTNTPLQALVLLNDPQFVEASRALGQRIMLEGGSDVEERIRFAFRTVLSRGPDSRETDLVRRSLRRELERFQQDPKAAEAYLSIGETDRDASLLAEEHAAWSTVAMLLLNMSETITKE